MKVKGFKYYVIYDRNNVIINHNDFKQEVNEAATVEILDIFGSIKGFNSLKQLEKYINDNNLTFPEQVVEINPFDSEWNTEKPDAKIRMYINSYNAALLAIDIPTFPQYLEQKGITLIPDANYDVVWAYLERIDEQDKTLLENERYNAKFEYRNV
jgi:hypothetical protein